MNFLDLIKHGRHQAIITHVRTCKCLATDEELALIERGNHEEIMAYITEHYFEPDSLAAFIKRAKLNEIRYYLSRFHPIHYGSWESIIALGTGILHETIDQILYHRNSFKKDSTRINLLPTEEKEFFEAWDDVMCLIVNSSDHCAIRRLITQTKLGPNSQDCLSQNGNAEDNLVYELRWGNLHRKH